MIDIQTLKKYDLQQMHETYDKWPDIAKDSYQHNFKKVDFAGIDHIVFAGMGGSGALGDIFSAILSKTDVHVRVVKGYLLPKTVDENTLVVTTSVSGETIETLSILDSAIKTKSKIIVFSSGGKIENYCKECKIEYRKIPMIHSPRASFTSYLYSMLKILEPVIPIKEKDVFESIECLQSTRKKISSDNLTNSNPSIELAEWILGIPMIYYPWGLQAAAIRFKNCLQENTKCHAITEDIIEACHNGIVAWEKKSSVQPILIEGQDDNQKTKERYRILKDYFSQNKIEYKEIFSVNGNILSKLINLVYFLDYTSIYKAIISEVDPSPVNSIDFIKKEIQKNY